MNEQNAEVSNAMQRLQTENQKLSDAVSGGVSRSEDGAEVDLDALELEFIREQNKLNDLQAWNNHPQDMRRAVENATYYLGEDLPGNWESLDYHAQFEIIEKVQRNVVGSLESYLAKLAGPDFKPTLRPGVGKLTFDDVQGPPIREDVEIAGAD